MASRQATKGMLAVLSCCAVMLMLPPAGKCQFATTTVDPSNSSVQLEGLSAHDLEQLISQAAQNGEINVSDANELINKLNDVDTLMQQFDFIQEQEKRMISSVGSSFH